VHERQPPIPGLAASAFDANIARKWLSLGRTSTNGSPLAYTDLYGLWALGDPVDQRIVDAVTGFGDAFLIPELIRDAFDFGTVDKCSAAYRGGKIMGVIWAAVPFVARTAAAVGATRFGQVLNANRYFRIGPGRRGKYMVPRISSPYLWGDWSLLIDHETSDAAAGRCRVEPGLPVRALAETRDGSLDNGRSC
jgi:hypothetical protein